MTRMGPLALLVFLAPFFVLSCNSRETSRTKTGNVKKQQIREFWDAYNRATSLRTAGRYDEAASAYEDSLRIDPRHEESLYYLGSTQMERGDFPGAEQAFRRLLELNPRSSRGLSQLGLLLSTPAPGARINPEEARRLFEQVARLNPEESGPFLRLGMLALRGEDADSARKHFQIAAGFKSPEGIFLSGYVCFREGDYAEAASHFQKVLEMNQNEKKISGRGVFSEGDISSSNAAMSPTEMAGIKALTYLHWSALQLGQYPESVPDEFRVLHRKTDPVVNIQKLPSSGKAAWCDFNSDSVPDVAVVGSRETRLYRNQAGKFSLALTLPAGGFDAVWGDYDGDHRQDLYLIQNGYLGEGQNTLFRNEGYSFRNVTGPAGLAGVRATSAAMFADVDNDSFPDLIEVGNGDGTTAPVRVYRNRAGKYHAQPITFSGNAVSLSVGDYNADGAPDLFILRWKRPALLFRNDGKGNFVDVTSAAGLQTAGGNSFSAVFVDFNHDPWPDIFVSRHAPYETALLCLLKPSLQRHEASPQLFLNVSGNLFREAGSTAGLHQAYGTVKAIPADLDRDGWTDLVLANGGFDPWRLEPAAILLNLRGTGFASPIRLPQNPSDASVFCSVADSDSDGRPEVFLP